MTTPALEARATPAQPTSLRAAWPALLALCLTMLVEMVDNSVLNIALPTIADDLHAGPSGLQWIVGAYSLTFGGLLMVGGTLGDKLGRRRALMWGLVGFGLSGLLVLFAHSTAELVGIRALSGAFAALIAPGTMSLTFRLFDDPKLRARAIGLIVSVAMIGVAVGPIVSGLAVAHLPWQVLLVVNAPVAAIAWFGVRRGIAPTTLLNYASFANLPTVAGMFLAGPIMDRVIERFGHRQAAVIGAVVLIASLLAITVSLGHGYIPFAIGTFVLTIGVRLVMTTCAVELIDSLPRDHTSIGAAMNDTAQEVGNAVGVGIVGTVSAMVVGTTLPGGVWPKATAEAFMHGLHISFALLAVVVTAIAWIAARSLSDSKALED